MQANLMVRVQWRAARPAAVARALSLQRLSLRRTIYPFVTSGPKRPSWARPGGACHCHCSAATEERAPEDNGRLGKRKVALFLGYEGTGYKGLQKNPETAPDATIEDTLEHAIFKAGGILPSNLGDLSKLRWGRSSRTDKSVHSLATVISLKMECDPDSFEADPEGLGLAQSINDFLPPEMRVFSVQRVCKNFSARSECIRRSYDYYLPASILGLKLDGGPEDKACLQRLAECWAAFEGYHAFHNYTKRRLYRNEAQPPKRGGPKRGRRDAEAAAAAEEDEEGSEGDASEWESGIGATAAATASSSGNSSEASGGGSGSGSGSSSAVPGELAAPVGSGSSCSSNGSGGGGGGAQAAQLDQQLQAQQQERQEQQQQGGGSGKQGAGRQPGNKIEVRWNEERDWADPVVQRHYRFMEWCRVGGEVVHLAPGGPPCVRLSLCGNSFMLHQIRKMVAASVAVARGQLPLALVRASLAAPARVVIPLAPPVTLVLSGAQFAPFRKSWDQRLGSAALVTGERLELRAGGAQGQQRFFEQVLQPALNDLLSSPEWAAWERNLEQLWYDEGEVGALLQTHAVWQGEQEKKRAARLEVQLTEAAALENVQE